jgi:hypothetical protein
VASVIRAREAPTLPPLDAELKSVAENKHLTSLPPHLQAELDALRGARALADAIGGKLSPTSKVVSSLKRTGTAAAANDANEKKTN